MGCLRNLGCLVLLVVIAAVAWAFRADWMPLVRGRVNRAAPVAAAPRPEVWESATPDGAARAKEAIQKLGERSGPVFANLSPGDLLAYVEDALAKQLPPSVQHIEASATDGQLWVRAEVNPSDLGGAGALGPLAGMLGDREPVRFGGTIDIVRPGLAELRVQSLRIRDLPVPSSMIPKLIHSSGRDRRPAGVAADALPIPVPSYIADVRIRNGKITLYKAVP
jgi:hypothetical protein